MICAILRPNFTRIIQRRLSMVETRRDWLAKIAMGVGLLLGYGTLAVQGLLFLLPKQLKPKTRRLFVGSVDRYGVGSVESVYDLEGNEILVKRNEAGFEAYSSTCPHLGCKVQWVPDKQEFFCPCHRGVFNADGVAVSGPPADEKQDLFRVPLLVESGVVYLEVKDVKRRKA